MESANLPTSRAVTVLIGFFRSWLHWRDYFGTTAHRCQVFLIPGCQHSGGVLESRSWGDCGRNFAAFEAKAAKPWDF